MILLACLIGYTLDDVPSATRPSDGDTIYVADVFDAIDTVAARTNQLNDTLDLRFIRFTDVKDSNFQRVNADSIMGVDVVRGNPDIDSISGLNVMSGNPSIDSIAGGVWWSGTGATFSDSVFIDTAKINYLYGAVSLGDVDINGNYLIIDTDADSRLYESADDIIAMSTNNVERFWVTTSGIKMLSNLDMNGNNITGNSTLTGHITVSDSLSVDTLTPTIVTGNPTFTGHVTISDSVLIDTAKINQMYGTTFNGDLVSANGGDILMNSSPLRLDTDDDSYIYASNDDEITTIINGTAAMVMTGTDMYTTDWTDYSSSSTVTGWSSTTLKEVYYKVVGPEIIVIYYISGTSNSTSANFTSPYAAINLSASNADQFYQASGLCMDNDAYIYSSGSSITGGGQLISVTIPSGAWTASGTKTISGTFRYFRN
jgi:hypothetical protein